MWQTICRLPFTRTKLQQFRSFPLSSERRRIWWKCWENHSAQTPGQACVQGPKLQLSAPGERRRQAEAPDGVEAEMDTREWTKPIATGDYISMRNAYMKVHGRLEDKVTPSKEYLEKKLQELENGEFRAETMAEVVSKDEVNPDVMVPIFDSFFWSAPVAFRRVALETPEWTSRDSNHHRQSANAGKTNAIPTEPSGRLVPIFDSKGSLTVKKGATTIPLPTGPEQLRRRLTVMVNAILMLAIKHTNREEIQDVTRDLFECYMEYVLGDYVWELSSTDLHGNQVYTNTTMDAGAVVRTGHQTEDLLAHGYRRHQTSFFPVRRLHGFRQVVPQVCTCRKWIVRSMQSRRLRRLQKRASADLYIVHPTV